MMAKIRLPVVGTVKPLATVGSAGLTLLSILVALLVGEGLTRLLSPQFLRIAIRESVDGVVVLRPDVRGRYYSPGEYDTTATVNSQRFRGTRKYSRNPASGTIRIAALGDSFTFGTGVEDDETYPAQLERFLNGRRSEPLFEVINAGIHGTGTSNQALWYSSDVQGYRPHIVILSIYANDLEDEARSELFELRSDGLVQPKSNSELARTQRGHSRLRSIALSLPGYDYLCQHSHLLNLIRKSATVLLTGPRRELNGGAATASPQVESGDRTQDSLLAVVHWLNRRVQEDGAELVVVYFPERDYFDADSSGTPRVDVADALIERLPKEGGSLGYGFLDLSPAIGSYLSQWPGSLYFERDFHFRAKGNEVVAREISKYLQNRTELWEKLESRYSSSIQESVP